MEFVSGQSLLSYVKKKNQLSEDEARLIFKNIVESVAYCHSNLITHRDLKLENVLLTTNNHTKLIDFGFSTCVSHKKKIKLFCGTPSYMAPEIVTRKSYSGAAADVWALGVILYVLLTGIFPFKADNDRDLYRRISRGVFGIPDSISEEGRDLLLRMLVSDP